MKQERATPTPPSPALRQKEEDRKRIAICWCGAVVAGLLLLRRRRRSSTKGRALAKEAPVAKGTSGGQAGGPIMDTARIQSTGGTDIPLSAGQSLLMNHLHSWKHTASVAPVSGTSTVIYMMLRILIVV